MEKNKTDIRLIVVGGSAGSLQVVFRILADLGQEFPVPLLLVLHRAAQDGSRLSDVLTAKTPIEVVEIEDKDPIQPGKVYVCPADYHVLIESDKTFSLDYSEKIHFSRPSIDVAFSAAADALGDQLVAVLLSGANTDGARGLKHVKEQGGITIIQHPDDAEVNYMPEQALLLSAPDHLVHGKEIGKLLKGLIAKSSL